MRFWQLYLVKTKIPCKKIILYAYKNIPKLYTDIYPVTLHRSCLSILYPLLCSFFYLSATRDTDG